MSQGLPKCLRHLHEGKKEQTCPTKDLPPPPPWLDPLLFQRGQKFAQEHFYALAYCDILSLIFLFSFKDSLDPLVYTGNSSCVFSAFNRYVSTACRVLSWYEGDVFDPNSEAGKNLVTVRQKHRVVIERLKDERPEELTVKSKIEKPMSKLTSVIRKDLDVLEGIKDVGHSVGPLPLNQWHSGITQFAFIGMATMYPEKLGIVFHTEEDLEALVHLWAVLGYMIGIKDEYNWCIDGLKTFRERGYALQNTCILPNLKTADDQWEHMSRCMARGTGLYMPSVTFESLLLYLFFVLDLLVVNLWGVLQWKHKFLYSITKFFMTVLIYIPGAKSFYNNITRAGLGAAKKADPKWLNSAKEKATLYHVNFKYIK